MHHVCVVNIKYTDGILIEVTSGRYEDVWETIGVKSQTIFEIKAEK